VSAASRGAKEDGGGDGDEGRVSEEAGRSGRGLREEIQVVKAYHLEEFGDPDVLVVHEHDLPEPGWNETLVHRVLFGGAGDSCREISSTEEGER